MSKIQLLLIIVILFSCNKGNEDPDITQGELKISYVYIGNAELKASTSSKDIALEEPVEIRFDYPINIALAQENIKIVDQENVEIITDFSFLNENKLVKIDHPEFDENSQYILRITENLKGENEQKFSGREYSFVTLTLPLILDLVYIDAMEVNPLRRIQGISQNPQIDLYFNSSIVANDIINTSSFTSNGTPGNYNINQVNDTTVSFLLLQTLEGFSKNLFSIPSSLESQIGKPFDGLELEFYTQGDTTAKFPEIPNEELLTLVQEQTFKYFWDFGHPVSGLSRERITSGDNVTSGGSGFGIMSILVGIERGFITHEQGLERINTIVDFLGNADRFHGAWSHWLSGSTGDVNLFSANDDGGDLVETSYMAMGLITVRQYLNSLVSEEKEIIDKINVLLDEIEWDWYTQGENSLTWHWSPNFGFEKNHKIKGWNEALITYVMAASSKNHSISKEVYEQGWGSGSNMVNGKQFYGINLPLGRDYGGPLFFEQYTFIGLDPRNLEDQYANYWEQVVNHTLINREYCITNPQNYVGYSKECWGLTASDGDKGYSAHAPNNDRGVITPTAAISSIPFTPDKSMDAIRYFYYLLGDKLWGEYGFYDAFNITENWYASSYLAIDQGPIILMIENYRTGLLWELFMSAPDVQDGLTKLGFTY